MKKREARTEILSFRVTPEEKEIIVEKALSSYRDPSFYLRDCALEKEIVVFPHGDEIAEELRRIGNNLNQLTRAANAGIIQVIDLSLMKEEVKCVWQSLNSLSQAAR